MRVVFILDSYNKKSGSFYSVVNNLVKYLLKKNIKVNVLTSDLLENNKKIFIDLISRAEICHFFGGWSFFHIRSFFIATGLKKVRIIHPMGFYDPWALKQKMLKKKIAWYFYQKRILSMADLIHCASDAEKKNLLKLNKDFKVKVLPFGVSNNFIKKKKVKKKLNKKVIFFSRLHKVKGIDDLIKAWNQLNNKDWKLDVVGPKDNNTFYKKIIKLSNKNSWGNVRFLKPIFSDQEKFKLFDRYDFLLLPSKSENFGMVILESLARGLPVLTTTNTPWQSIKKYNAGWVISNDYSSLVKAINKIFYFNEKKFNIKSNNAINLAKNYKLNLIIKKYLKVYIQLIAIKQGTRF